MGNKKKRERAFRYFFGGLFLILVSILVVGYIWTKNRTLPHVSIRFETANGSSQRFDVEVVHTPTGRAKGLMFRRKLDPKEGMIFVFPESDDHSFYMKNTYVSLDMIFVSEDNKIAGIIESVPILNTQSRTIGKPSKYVIELLAGTTKRLGLKAGDTVLIDGTLPNPR